MPGLCSEVRPPQKSWHSKQMLFDLWFNYWKKTCGCMQVTKKQMLPSAKDNVQRCVSVRFTATFRSVVISNGSILYLLKGTTVNSSTTPGFRQLISSPIITQWSVAKGLKKKQHLPTIRSLKRWGTSHGLCPGAFCWWHRHEVLSPSAYMHNISLISDEMMKSEFFHLGSRLQHLPKNSW